MQYALLIYTRPGSLDGFSKSERQAMYGEYVAVSELPGFVGTARLQPVETRRANPGCTPRWRGRGPSAAGALAGRLCSSVPFASSL